jgi:hypothetical protein
VEALPEYAPLKAKLPAPGQETVDQLTDTSLATDEQAAAIKATYPRTQACHIVGENQIKKVLPGSAMVFLDTDQQVDDAYADLQNRKLSWGDFLRKRKTVLDGFTRGMLAQLKQVGLM